MPFASSFQDNLIIPFNQSSLAPDGTVFYGDVE